MCKRSQFICVFYSLVLFIASCNNLKNDAGKTPALRGRKSDTLSNKPQFQIEIEDKQFYIVGDSIKAWINSRDTSVTIIVKGVENGYLIVSIPALSKCPGSFTTGYKSAYLKKFDSGEFDIQPTVALHNYPLTDMSLKNASDGFHEEELRPDALTVSTVFPIDEGNGKKLIVKGSIKTTVLKNVYEAHAGEVNKDYKIKGDFVVQVDL